MKKVSQLVEVVGTCDINVLVDFHLSAFRDRRNAKDDDSNVLTETSMSAYSMGGRQKPLGAEA